jgi:hypothetical protein
MRLCGTVLVLFDLIVCVCAVDARADDAKTSAGSSSNSSDSGSSNSANDPTEPRLTLEYWNYYAPSLNQLNGDAENGILRALIPFTVGGIQQEMHVIPSLVTAPAATSGPRTGLGDTQIYNFTLTKQDIGLPEKVTFGIGPLIAVPTATSTNFGPDSLQGGVAGAVIAPQSWGLLGVLATYQHTLWGPSSSVTSVQPNVFYNLDHGFYLRSSAVMTYDTFGHTTVIPIGFGAGKVVQLDGGYTLNAYVEAQPSLYRAGVGAPVFQIFTGIKIQFPASVSSNWKF